jgi:hypothetical protein
VRRSFCFPQMIRECPLLARSEHSIDVSECPLLEYSGHRVVPLRSFRAGGRRLYANAERKFAQESEYWRQCTCILGSN